jgi:hypothetical protein
MILKCLSVRQPWASAILLGLKAEEYRSRPTRHRGPLLIHAGLKPCDREASLAFLAAHPEVAAAMPPLGHALGLADVVGCEPHPEYGFAWRLARPRLLVRPVPVKGQVGLFAVEIDDAILPAPRGAGVA